MKDMEKPNIVLIMGDQLSAERLGCYGHPSVKSPNIDLLASEGVRFENAYCASPLCAPSRAALMSGVLPSRLGVYDNGSEFAASGAMTAAHYLRAVGYDTVASGKLHYIGPDQLHGLHRRLTKDIYPAGFDWTPARWDDGVQRNPGASVDAVRDSGVCRRSLQLDYDDAVAERARQFLYDQARLGSDRPFFLTVSFTHPHDPFYITQEYWDRYRDDEIDDPAVGPIPNESMHAYDRWLQYHHCADVVELNSEEIRAARRAYYGMISYLDDKVGEVLSILEELSLRENTAVIFTSDHGEMLGERGMWYKRTFYDASCKVPLIISAADLPAQRVSVPVSLLDLVPTLASLAGAPLGADSGLDGVSLLGPGGAVRGERRPVIAEYLGEGVAAPCRMVRTGAWKYVYVHGESEQLFNLDDDPHELRNEASTPEAKGVLEACRDAMLGSWDPTAEQENVRKSQALRRSIIEACDGTGFQWDYTPGSYEELNVVRGSDAQEASRRRRL